MQPYPWSPDLVWPGHLHGTGCLSARAMDTGLPIVVWRLCLGPGCALVSVTPPALPGLLGWCVWVRVVVSPISSRLGFAMFPVGLGFRPAPHHSWLGSWGRRGCVRAPPVPRRSRIECARPLLGEVFGCVCVRVLVPPGPLHLLAGGALRVCVLGPGLLPRCRACVCLCACPACTQPFLALVCRVGVCAGLGFPLCPAPLGWGVGVCVRSCVCPGCIPPFLGGHPWRGGVRVLLWVRFAPPLPFGFFLGQGASWRVVSWLCAVGRWLSRFWVSWSPSLLPLSFGLRVCVCLSRSPPQRGVCLRVRGVPPSGGTLLSVWCCRFWLGGPPVPNQGVPIFGAVWLGGLAASCDLGGRFRGCGPFSCPPPPLFFGRGDLHVPPSAFPGRLHALVGILCGLPGCCWCLRFARPCPGPMGRVGYVHVGLGGLSCRVRFWLCRLGGCARRLREALG